MRYSPLAGRQGAIRGVFLQKKRSDHNHDRCALTKRHYLCWTNEMPLEENIIF